MRELRWILLSFVLAVAVGCGGGGGGGGSDTPPAATPAQNNAPTPIVLASGQVAAAQSGTDLTASVGGELSLSAAQSTDGEDDILTFDWQLKEKPATSQLDIHVATAVVTFTPDAIGTYKFALRVTDSKGAYGERDVSVVVDNSAPTPSVLITATFAGTSTINATQIISVGAPVLLDATASTDPEGNPLTVTWSFEELPIGSAASLAINDKTARFTADSQGIYKVTARAQDPYGAYSDVTYVLDAQNQPPNAILISTITPVVNDNGQSTVQASVGYSVLLDGSTSSDAESSTLIYAWQLVSKPALSTATLSSATGSSSQIVPDILGSYVVRLTVTDGAGASAIYTKTISVNNNRPIADINTNASPVALPSAPTIRIPVNTQLTLRGTGSSDADGQALTYLWSIASAPVGSAANLATPSASTTQFVPDLSGSYSIRLRVTDPAGAYSERLLTIATGNYPPVAVIDKNWVSVIAGGAVSASAAMSYDEDADNLTYSWAVDSSPALSNAVIASPNSATLNFTPDVAGTYVISVTVNDGSASNVAYVTLRSLASTSGSVELDFVPLNAKYSKGLDKLILIAANPDTLKIVDPFTSVVKTVTLPFSVKSFGLSPNGKLAAVLHEGRISLVDLETAQLVHTSFTNGSQTDAFLQDDGFAYLIGQLPSSSPVTVMNTQTGDILPSTLPIGSAFFYGTQKGVFANTKNKILFMSYGVSPSDISYFTIDPTQHTPLISGDSPYHGDYLLGQEFYLTENQSLLFTSVGTFFNVDTLNYAGSLGLSGELISMTQSTAANELLLLQMDSSGGSWNFSSAYKRYHGALFQFDADIPLPTINGEQGFGIKLFHSSNNNHVVLLQTGSATPLDPGIEYHVIYR